MNNWPYPDKPGVPLNPERDGWHWLLTPEQALYPCWWNTIGQKWIEAIPINRTLSQCWRPKDCAYFSPCLPPSEVAAQVEQARRQGAEAMREACAAYVMCGCDTAEQARVVAAATTEGLNSAARWRACHRSDCLALMAAEVLDLPLPGDDE